MIDCITDDLPLPDGPFFLLINDNKIPTTTILIWPTSSSLDDGLDISGISYLYSSVIL